MPPKRKARTLQTLNNKEKFNQMSFFDPVYQNDSIPMNDDESDSDLSVNGLSQGMFHNKNKDQSSQVLDDIQISTSKLALRIKQIQNSIQQAQTMLESMEKFKHLVPGSQEQCEKLRVIIGNLEEQQAGYVNLLNLVTLTNKEKSALIDRISSSCRSTSTNTNGQSNDDEGEDEDVDDDRSSRCQVQSPVRPRIESKIGFIQQPVIPLTPTTPYTINSSDNEQNTRNDNSNYDSLIGSLKSDTLNWKDQQLTSGDETTDAESGKEIEKNLLLQKEQLRALQGQKRALLALKKRSERRLIEQQQRQQQQQQLTNQNNVNTKEDLSEHDFLSDINSLRDRLKLLRNLYEQKHQVEVRQVKNSSKQRSISTEERLQALEHVREQLNELEQILTYYQFGLMNEQEETTTYEEKLIQPDDARHLQALLTKQKQITSSTTMHDDDNKNDNIHKPLEKLSSELTAKRLELEEAKTTLNHLQQMVRKIGPNDYSSSARSTPIRTQSIKPTGTNDYELSNHRFQYNSTSSQQTQTQSPTPNVKTSLLSNILSSKTTEQEKSMPIKNDYADAKMAAQHREIERLIESRQRLHSIKDQIASLHESMTTPPARSKQVDSSNQAQVHNQLQNNTNESKKQISIYDDKLKKCDSPHPIANSRRIQSPYISRNREENDMDDDNDSELYRFGCESGDGEEINGSDTDEEIQPRMKQGNYHAPEDIVAEHEQRLLNKKSDSTNELSSQMREICRCLSTFIQEQKSFNRHIEEHLKAATNLQSPRSTSISNTSDPVFNQLQQQVLTQGLIVNLNAAYREIAVLQSEINALQSENNRLTSSASSRDSQYHNRSHLYSRDDSKESLYSFDQMKLNRPQIHSRLDENIRGEDYVLKTNNKFENSSKTSFNSQSTGQQTAIHLNENHMERTPTKNERNATITVKRSLSPKPVHFRSKIISNKYETSPNHHRQSTKENNSKSFVIRRRPVLNDKDDNFIKSQLFNYDQQSLIDQYQELQQNTFHDDDDNDGDDDDDDDNGSESDQQTNNLTTTIRNTQPSTYYRSAVHAFDNIDLRKLHDQVKSVMTQLIPFMKLHVNDKCNQSILIHIRERIIFLFKQKPYSSQVVHQFQTQFSESLDKAIEKYCGVTIRNCATELIRDISDTAFNELVKYKIFQNSNNIQTTDTDEQVTRPLIKQDEYSTLYDSSVRHHYQQQTSSVDDGESDNKYQIELAESESRPLMLIGSDEEDNDSDQEENKDSELETAVSRQESHLNQNEMASSTEFHSNGHEYILVTHSTRNNIVDENAQKDEEKTNERQEIADS